MKTTVINFLVKNTWKIFLAFLALGIFYPPMAIVAGICMIAPIVIALLGHGRYWCGNFCPRGNFYDKLVVKIAGKKKPKAFISNMYIRFGVMAFMFTMFGSGLYFSRNWHDTGMVFYRIIAITTVVGFASAFFVNHRIWCSVCPIGTISSVIAKKKQTGYRLAVDEKCTSCGLCAKNCPIGIDARTYKGGTISHSDCLSCGACSDSCRKSYIKRA